MVDQKKIVWLASYPKSGNTWFRAFLTSLFNKSGKIDINNLYPTTIASNRELFDELSGVSSSDLSFDEIDLIRSEVYRQNAFGSNEIIYHKVHDSWKGGDFVIFPQDITKAVLYFIRNPLDVAVSFAQHLSISIDRTIDIMEDSNFSFSDKKNRLHIQLNQRLNTWSGHVKSWVNDSELPLLVIRYEDIKNDALETFSKAIKFIDLDYSLDEINKAIENASFSNLKNQELRNGFKERNPKSIHFFRKGMVGDWRNNLTLNQIKRIIDAHKVEMIKYGYL